MKLGGHIEQYHLIDYQQLRLRPCGDRDIFVGVATLSKITQLIISHLAQGNVATQFHGWELQKNTGRKTPQQKTPQQKTPQQKTLRQKHLNKQLPDDGIGDEKFIGRYADILSRSGYPTSCSTKMWGVLHNKLPAHDKAVDVRHYFAKE